MGLPRQTLWLIFGCSMISRHKPVSNILDIPTFLSSNLLELNVCDLLERARFDLFRLAVMVMAQNLLNATSSEVASCSISLPLSKISLFVKRTSSNNFRGISLDILIVSTMERSLCDIFLLVLLKGNDI